MTFTSSGIAADVSDAAGLAYWAAVVAVAPVLALALLVEGRRAISKASPDHRWLRRFSSALPAVGLLLLALVFGIGLSSLAAGSPPAPTADFVNVLLTLVFTVVAVNPLLELALRVNSDALSIAAQFLPFSSWARTKRARKQTLRLMKMVLKLRERSLSLLNSNISLSQELYRHHSPKIYAQILLAHSQMSEKVASASTKEEREEYAEKLRESRTSRVFVNWKDDRSAAKIEMRRYQRSRRKTRRQIGRNRAAIDQQTAELRAMRRWRLEPENAEAAAKRINAAYESLRREESARVLS